MLVTNFEPNHQLGRSSLDRVGLERGELPTICCGSQSGTFEDDLGEQNIGPIARLHLPNRDDMHCLGSGPRYRNEVNGWRGWGRSLETGHLPASVGLLLPKLTGGGNCVFGQV